MSCPSICLVPGSECSSYTTISDATRNINYGDVNHQCDRTITTKWYRFSAPAGVRMPSSCTVKDRCDTDATGWLSDPHPTVEQGIVSRKVCYSWGSSCCSFTNDIRVRNCGSFYVYEFKPTSSCSFRYCGTT